MSNIQIIENTDPRVILAHLSREGITSGHFTNGTYMYNSETIVPTVLAGFKYLADQYQNSSEVFIIAVNSDKSMADIMDAKNASTEERSLLEGQQTRALKVVEPLSIKHSNRDIIVMFYDESTPTPLYDFLSESGFGMKTLHKWGYGTDFDSPRIEGAHNFSQVYAFPLPNDTKPVCYNLTVAEDQSDVVKVIKLTEESKPNGQPYIAPKLNI